MLLTYTDKTTQDTDWEGKIMTRAYERLLRYAAIDTGSDETSAVTPSSAGQLVLAKKLAEEFRELGVSDV